MVTTLDTTNISDDIKIQNLETENNNYRAALEEAYRAIRWYVTTLALAVLSYEEKDGAFIFDNSYIDTLEEKFMGKEISFDVEELEDLEGWVRILIKYHNSEESTNETVSEDQGD
jgi:hypothetical protein